MPNASGDPEAGVTRFLPSRGGEHNGQHRSPGGATQGSLTAVAAHVLLNKVSSVLLGAATLDKGWDALSPSERRTIVSRLHQNMIGVAEQVKAMVHRPLAPPLPGFVNGHGTAQVRVRVNGPLDGLTGGYRRDRVVEAGLEPGCEELLLDLYAVTSVDADGVAAVLAMRRELTAVGVRLAVLDAPGRLRPSLESAGLTEPDQLAAVTVDLRS